jgi:hypothetical protein
MKNKLEFIKWIFTDLSKIDYWLTAMLILQTLASYLMFALDPPYDMYAVHFQILLISCGAIYFFIVYPLMTAYERFLDKKRRNDIN